MFRRSIPLLAAAGLLSGASASAVTVTPPAGDRWMYPFNFSAGSEPTASLFGAPNDPSFDDRDSQYLLDFDTTGQIAPGQGAANYRITSARLTLTLKPTGQQGTWNYDPTYDSHTTYGGGTDTDPGRPIELYGVGYRNGFTTASFTETSAFSPPGAPAPGVRNAYASDGYGGVARDVSNNVRDAFDPNPWAIGNVAGISPGDLAPGGAQVVFDLVLSPDVVAYLQERLDAGEVDLLVTGLFSAVQGGPATYPRFETQNGSLAGAGVLELDVQVVPEPGTALLVGAGLAGLVARARLRR